VCVKNKKRGEKIEGKEETQTLSPSSSFLSNGASDSDSGAALPAKVK
jgi:hypothetical protein